MAAALHTCAVCLGMRGSGGKEGADCCVPPEGTEFDIKKSTIVRPSVEYIDKHD